MEQKKQIIEHCYHCGNMGLLNINYEFIKKSSYNFDGPAETFIWKLLSCPVCGELSLQQNYTDETMLEYNGEDVEQFYETEIVYPIKKMLLHEVPLPIKNAFEVALKIEKIDHNMCVASLRRTLELICKEKNAVGKDLFQKIKFLISEKIFPTELEEAYFLIKDYGNEGIHEENINLSDYEISQLIKILYDVINYLYIVPKKLSVLKAKRTNRKKKVK